MMQFSTRRYLIVFAIIYLLIASAIILFKRWDIVPWIHQCNPNGYDNGYFMAYCHSEGYGDYEHWAYWNEADPVSIEPVKHAQLLFLGNSRTQYAFSTDAVVRYFAQKNIAHYVFGFGMGSYSPVPELMMEKYHLQPRVLVVNADPFFADIMNGTNKKMQKTDFTIRWEFMAKRLGQRVQQHVCSVPKHNDWLHRTLCSGTAETIYREPQFGHWKTDYYREDKHIPVTYTDFLMDQLDATTAKAKAFIDRWGGERRCMIITVTPRTGTPLRFARLLAERLGTPGVFPEVDNLITIDDSHLNTDSAERWSAAFFQAATPYIDACLTDTTPYKSTH